MYLFISIIILFASYRLFKKASGTLDIRKLNISSFVFYSLFLMTFIGSLQIQYNLAKDTTLPNDEELHTFGWIVVMYAMVAVPIGMLTACKLFKIKSIGELISNYTAAPLHFEHDSSDIGMRRSQYIFSILSALAVIYTVGLQGENTPLIHLILGSDDYMQMGMLRHDSGFQQDNFAKTIISPFGVFSTLFFYSAYSYYKTSKRKSDLIWLCTMMIFSLVITTYNLVKNPILYWLIGLYIVHALINKKVALATLTGLTIIVALLVGISTIFIQGARDDIGVVNILSILEVSLEVFTTRISYGQLLGTYHCLDIFPDKIPHILFSSTGNVIHQIFNAPYSPSYGILVMAVVRPDWATAGHYTTYFMGEAWANFGLIGIILAPLWVGFLIQSLHIAFLRLRKTPLNVAAYGLSFTMMPTMTDFQGFYYPVGFIVNLFIIIAVYKLGSLMQSARAGLKRPEFK
jgi:hypothetical protein